MNLFDKIYVGGLEIRNRIVMPPMTTRFADPDGYATEQSIAYYGARGQGGAGLILVEMSGVDLSGKHRERELGIYDDKFIPALGKLTRRIKGTGARAGIQLAHGGGQALQRVTGVQSVAPSAIPYVTHEKFTETHTPKELSVEEIEGLISRFVEAAERAKAAGFEIVEVHGANGYLIYQFLSPLTNKRTDQYGGDLNGRARIGVEVVQAIKKKIPDLPLLYRISIDEFADGGVSPEEALKVCAMIEKAGADGIHVSVGSYLSTYPYMIPPMMLPPGFFLPLGKEVKKTVKVPVIVPGRLHDPYLANNAIETGCADLVAIGRQLIADPKWPRKIYEERLDEIRRCISCNYCINSMRDGAAVECASNAQVGSEWLQES
jgi:2,4-dienoyl-CoA reductase-like NADH-dependent reductase (Old Yellow Enzyme family)